MIPFKFYKTQKKNDTNNLGFFKKTYINIGYRG